MSTNNELPLDSSDYWLKEAQLEIYRQVVAYKGNRGIEELQQELGINHSALHHILKQEANIRLNALMTLSLVMGKTFFVRFSSMEKVLKEGKVKSRSTLTIAPHRDELRSPDYWMKIILKEFSDQLEDYKKQHHVNQTHLQTKLGVSSGYLTKVLKGVINISLKKFIELSMAVEKVPRLQFISLEKILEKGRQLPAKISFQYLVEPQRPKKK